MLDITLVHDFLTNAYWCRGISVEQVRSAAEHALTFAIYQSGEGSNGRTQVAYARVATDYVSMAYLMDVFVVPAHRGKGLASWLIESILANPNLSEVRSWMLATDDAHALYEKHGFWLMEAGKHMKRGGAPLP